MNTTNYLNDIRKELFDGKKITVQSVLRSVGTQELRHYLSKLKHEGLLIQSKWISRKGKHFKQYWIDQKQAAA